MRTRNFSACGANARHPLAVCACSLGEIRSAQSDRGICAILLGDAADALTRDLESFPPDGPS